MYKITITMCIDPREYGVSTWDSIIKPDLVNKRVAKLAKSILKGNVDLPKNVKLLIEEGTFNGYETVC